MKAFSRRITLVAKYPPRTFRRSLSAFHWIKSSGVIDALRRANDKKMESAPGNKPKPLEKSYLSAAVESISPWGGSRSTTPKATTPTFPGEGSGLKNHGGDHSTSHWPGWSAKNYPPDCPPLNTRWFHAVDVCPLTAHIHKGPANKCHRYPNENQNFSKTAKKTPNLPLRQRNSSPSPNTILTR
jgi:hypothetical protein